MLSDREREVELKWVMAKAHSIALRYLRHNMILGEEVEGAAIAAGWPLVGTTNRAYISTVMNGRGIDQARKWSGDSRKALWHQKMRILSLDKPIHKNQTTGLEITLKDLIPGYNYDPVEWVSAIETMERLSRIPRKWRIACLEDSLEEKAVSLGVTQNRVSQMKKKAMRRVQDDEGAYGIHVSAKNRSNGTTVPRENQPRDIERTLHRARDREIACKDLFIRLRSAESSSCSSDLDTA